MGRYNSTGIIYQYEFEKSTIPGIESYEIKQQVIKQLFPEIYDFREDEESLYFNLSRSITASDIISAMDSYYDIFGVYDIVSEEFERVKMLLEGKTLDEAYEAAEEKRSYLYRADELFYRFYNHYRIRLVINGERDYYPVRINSITIARSAYKTVVEDDLYDYYFFTNLLRYRMKPLKLADAMIFYLSA